MGGDRREEADRSGRLGAAAATARVRAAGRFALAAGVALLLAALCLAVFAWAPGSAAAQEPAAETLLRIDSSTSFYQLIVSDTDGFSQKFRTGPNPGGYRLTSVSWSMRFFLGRDYGPIEARIYSVEDPEARGRGRTLLYTLEGPDEISDDSFSFDFTTSLDVVFTAPPGATLEASTHYHIEFVTDTSEGSGLFEPNINELSSPRVGGAVGWRFHGQWFTHRSGCNCYDRSGSNWQMLAVELEGHTLPGVPTAPRSPRSSSRAFVIDLAWDPPLLDGESPITGYRVEVSEDEGATWTDLAADTGSADTSYRHTPLPIGADRSYRVSAINAHGTSEVSSTRRETVSASGLDTLLESRFDIYGGTPAHLILNATGHQAAQAFRTGPNPAGYALRALQVNADLQQLGSVDIWL